VCAVKEGKREESERASERERDIGREEERCIKAHFLLHYRFFPPLSAAALAMRGIEKRM
jgi:hypothetical protein